MIDAEKLRGAIKQQLKGRGLRYADVAEALSISEVSVKRMLSKGGMSLERLDAICRYLGMDVLELARAAQKEGQRGQILSMAQERALADDPRLLTLFHVLSNDWEVAQVRERFAMSEPEAVTLLARLDRLKLIELLPKNRVRLRVPRDFIWRSDGPVLQRYGHAAMAEFLRDDFSVPDALLRLEIRELSKPSLAVLRKQVEKLALDYVRLAEADSVLPSSQRQGIGMVLAIRPWVFSLLDVLHSQSPRT